MKKALIIGASGFLGGYLAQLLSSEGYAVDGMDRVAKAEHPVLKQVWASEQLEQLRPDYEVIFLLASFIPYGQMDTPNSRFVSDNMELVWRVCKHFVASRIVFTSSVSVYGTNTELPISEKSAYLNPVLYGLSKLAGEAIVRNHSSWAVVRFSSLYGQAMSPTTFIPRAIQEALTKRTITLWGDGSRLQDYFHVRDAAQICLAAARGTSNGVFLGVNGSSFSNKQVAELVQSHLPQTQILYINEDKSPSAVYDNSFTQHTLNWKPTEQLQEQIRYIIDYEQKKL